VLVEAGANLSTRDTAWNGTPLGWAEHYRSGHQRDKRGRQYAEPEASDLVLEAYPAPVRGWIIRRGGLTSRLLLLRGRELTAIYPSCR